MATIEELREKKRAYVKEEAQSIADFMISNGLLTYRTSTCDAPNWNRELHQAMPEIRSALNEMGIHVSCSVNWGVTDWVFSIRS